MEALTQYRLQRRTLLKGLGVIGLASLSPCFFTTGKANAETLRRIPLKLSDYKTYRSTCAMECLHCNLTAWVWQDRLVKIEASKDFNVKCCLRGISRTKWVYHPLRLTQPLLRTGEKGEGKFKPITWDDA
ncbi:DMSO reductase, partial [Salmonella enterica subsp. enterica serovar Enteritidis]|nr:DMSO reductase [Salmonella enterica subsp. enterica serovar Enteritidis]